MPTVETKSFPVLDVLTLVTGRSVSPKRIGAVYEILDWMKNANLFTHQLPAASDECKPVLLTLFPELIPTMGSMKSLDGWIGKAPTCKSEGIKIWLAELKMTFPDIKDNYDIPRLKAYTRSLTM